MELHDANKPLIVMTVLDRTELTKQTWASLAKTCKYADILVLDNGSQSQTESTLHQLQRDIPILNLRILRWNRTLPNIAAAVNAGLLYGMLGNRKTLIKVDNDVLLPDNADTQLDNICQTNGVGVIGIKVTPGNTPTRRIKHSGTYAEQPLTGGGARYIRGACCAIASRAILQVGYLDETLPRDEDFEYCTRMAAVNLHVLYLYNQTLKHLGHNQATEGEKQKREKSTQAVKKLSVRRVLTAAKFTVWRGADLQAAKELGPNYYLLPDEINNRHYDQTLEKMALK